MDLRLWLWLTVTYCFLLHLTVTRRLRKSKSRRGLQAEVQSEMIPYTDDQAILKCITSPSATVEWLFDGESITSTSDTNNNNQKRFTVDRNKLIVHLEKKVSGDLPLNTWSQNPFKSRLFQCKATLNDETVISEPAKLIITFLDDFDPQLDQQINTVQGNTAVIPCKPPNSMPIALTEYYVDNTLISKSDDRYLLTNSGNLQILDSQVSDSGLYRCVAFNAFLQERRNASWTIRLNVKQLPQQFDSTQESHPIYSPNNDKSAKNNVHFVVKPANETKAVMGSNVTLECVAQGIKSSPKIVWFKKRNGEEKLLTNKRKSRQIAGNLLLITIDENDSGVYVCRATVDDVSIEANAVLDVQMTPRFNKSIKDTTVNEGDNFTLECQATGNPKPRINWFFNGKTLNSHQYDKDKRSTSRLGFTQMESQSQLPGITFSDDYAKLTVTSSRWSIHSGIFQCFASNEVLNNDYKSTYSLAHVKVLRPGETADNSRLSETDRSVRLTDSSYVSPDNPGEIYATNVKPNLEGGGGGGGRGRKRQGKPMIPPTKPKVNRLSDDSVMVYWDLSNKTSLPVDFFKLQYKELAPKSKWNTLSEEIPPHITTQTVSGLVPDSKYRFRVMAVFNNSDYRESPVSDKFHLIRTSMLKKPKESPTIVAAIPQSPISIEVVWDSYKESAATIEGFIIHFRATSSAGDYFQITVPGSSKLSHIVSKLSPSTSYEFKLQCFNSAGVSDYSKILTATTFDDPVSTTTEIITVIKGLDKNLDSRIEDKMDIFLFIVGGIGVFALSVFIVCCIVQCRFKQNPKRKKDGPSSPQRANGELSNGSLIHNHHQKTQSSDEYKSETDTLSSHPDKSSINNVTASVSIDHFPAYHEEIKDKRNNYQTRTYMIDTYCDETPYGNGGRTGSWSRKSRKKCFETDAGVKLIATASSHNSLQRKYLYENDNHVSSTLERRRSTFKSEEHLKCSLNARIHSKSSSFTKLDGTLERKKRRANGTTGTTTLSPQPPPVPERSSYLSNHRSLSSSRLNGSLEKRKKSRPDYVNTNSNTIKNGNKSTESKMNSYNGAINHMSSKPPLLIMQSTC